MHNVKHIFFDLDNTLWDFEKNSREALLHLFSEHAIDEHCQTDFDTFVAIYEVINHELWDLYSAKKTTKEELRYQRFYKTFLHFNYDNLALAHHWADDYLKISPYKTHLIEGAVEVLTHLKGNYQLHIITNGFKEVQHIKLDQSKLKSYFDHIIISEEHGFNKPDRRIFDLAQSLTAAESGSCVMIGDNYDADIIGALNAQWKAIYLSGIKTTNEDQNYSRIETLAELKEIFK
jgi:putative hydrolase of the HAD superfamily